MKTRRLLLAITAIATVTLTGLLVDPDSPAIGKGKPGGSGDGGIPNPAFAYVESEAIHVITIDGSQKLKITNPPPRTEDSSPTWSPDLDPDTAGYQGKIAYLNYYEPGKVSSDLYAINPDGTGRQLVRRFDEFPWPDDGPHALSWSPNGKEIVFSALGDALFAVEVASGEVRLLLGRLFAKRQISHPAVSAFGMLAFSTDGDVYVTDFQLDADGLMRIDPATATIINVTGDQFDPADTHPSWSPDGTRIAYLRYIEGPSGYSEYDQLVVYDLLLDEFTLVLEEENPFLAVIEPSWSPDSSQIAIHAWFASKRDWQWDIVRIKNWDDAANRQVIRVTQTDRAHEGYPQWSPGWEAP